jgi:hypothetical protein
MYMYTCICVCVYATVNMYTFLSICEYVNVCVHACAHEHEFEYIVTETAVLCMLLDFDSEYSDPDTRDRATESRALSVQQRGS